MAGSSTREVITLQFGHYSNFVGTHWANIQESSFCYDPSSSSKKDISHDVLFREGLTLRGEQTYTPRLLIFDLKGSLRNLPRYGTLYKTTTYGNESLWSGNVSVHECKPEPKNEFLMDLEEELMEFQCDTNSVSDSETLDRPSISSFTEEDKRPLRDKFYNLDQDILVWSDFLGTSLHPKSIQLIRDFCHEEGGNPFDVFGYGQHLAKEEHFYDEFENNLHFFVEECDSLQGFQIFTDVSDGFGGLSSQILEELKDEYSAKTFISFGLSPAQCLNGTNKKAALRILNSALSYGRLSEFSDLFVPLSLASETWPHPGPAREFPLLIYQPSLPYHTSSVIGVCVDTVTMPYRLLTPQASTMNSFVESVAFGERTVASLSSTFPLPVEETSSLSSLFHSRLNKNGKELLQSLTPGMSSNCSVISQSAVVRGIPTSLVCTSSRNIRAQTSLQNDSSFEACSSASEIVHAFLRNLNPNASSSCWNVNQACIVKPPFPNIFAPKVTADGFVMEGYTRPKSCGVNLTSVLSCLETNSGISDMLLSLVHWAKKVDIRKHHVFLESGTEVESFNGILEELSSLSQRYKNP
ncbi:protein misato homolog 1-like [Montipora capricornis]|uniref:protein misato homolog 1-like n=1 Tax=Montipora capricornis TaxID=246305 RepID=UPI0035F11EC1